MKKRFLFTFAGALLFGALTADAQVRITEVSPWSSTAASAPYAADWFELTNLGATSVTITGWTMDDDSNNPNSALLSGISAIAPGESVVFLELAGGGDANALRNSFLATWFGSAVPAGLQIDTYTQGVAGGVGRSGTADAVNIFNGTAGTLQARLAFGASDTAAPLQTFDNSSGQDGVTLSTLSVVGTNGAFAAANNANEVGSPGRITAVPEPQTYALLLVGVLGTGPSIRKRFKLGNDEA